MLALHGKWVETHPVYSLAMPGGEPSGQRANLCEAELKEVHLPGATLQGANLQGANLWKANLQGAELWEANLQEAVLGSDNSIEDAKVRLWPMREANMLSGLFTGLGADLRGAKLGRANLQGAQLIGVNLQGADLWRANLQEAKLLEVNLQEVQLREANLQGAFLLGGVNLQGASLQGAQLQGAQVHGANLREADLSEANLQKTVLTLTNLQGAVMLGANLQEAALWRVNLQEAVLEGVNLTEALYEPISTPDKGFLGGLQGLATVRFTPGQQSGLVLLRAALKETGLRSLEREATYALKHTERCWNWPVGCHPWFRQQLEKVSRAPTGGQNRPDNRNTLDGLFNFLLFELTTAYGLKPGRALYILFGLIPIFALLCYLPAILFCRRRGIWVCWAPERVHVTEGDDKPERLTGRSFFPRFQEPGEGRWWGGTPGVPDPARSVCALGERVLQSPVGFSRGLA